MIPQLRKIQTHKTEIHPLSYLKVRLFCFNEWPWAPAWMLLTGLWRRTQRGSHHAGSARIQHRMGWPRGQVLTTLLPHLGQVMDTPHSPPPPHPPPSQQCLLTWPWAGYLLWSPTPQLCGPPGSRDFWLQSLRTVKESLRTPPASSLKGVKLNR